VSAVVTSLAGSGVSIAVAAATGLLLLGAGLMLRRLAQPGESIRPRSAPGPPAVQSAETSAPCAPFLPRGAGPSTGPRLLPEGAISAFARTLERSRRLVAAEDRMACELGELSSSHWLVERHVLVANQRVPFVLAGPTGVFLLGATDGAWGIHDLLALSQLTPIVRERLPAYEGSIQVGVCMAFDEMAPRTWHAGTDGHGHGGWIVGLDWLVRWLHSLDSPGLETGDIDALQTAARPVWTRRATARLPHVRNFG
jgi:hypothetical protein